MVRSSASVSTLKAMCCSVPGAEGPPGLPAWVLPISLGMPAISGVWTKAIDDWSFSFIKPCQAPLTPSIQQSATSSMPSTSEKYSI
jgi:hypothetical protein